MTQPTSTHAAASVLHDELLGTAAADFPDSLKGLLRHADLGDEWIVVGLEVDGSYRASWGAVLAVPRPPEGRWVEWSSYAAKHDGALPVRRFPLKVEDLRHDVPAGMGLLSHLKRWSVRLVLPAVEGIPLQVVVDD